jgi:hypothetical protein
VRAAAADLLVGFGAIAGAAGHHYLSAMIETPELTCNPTRERWLELQAVIDAHKHHTSFDARGALAFCDARAAQNRPKPLQLQEKVENSL